MEIEYYKLRIMLNTNNDKQVELKPGMFIFDSNATVSGEGPYMCTNIKYSKSILLQLPHKDQVEIFMNEAKFKDFCLTSRGKNGSINIKSIKDSVERNRIINENILIMLNALFPVSFPISDYVESLCPSINYKFGNVLFKPEYYTHLKVDEDTTVTRAVWINVMHQHPAYKKLYDIVKKYYKRMYNYIFELIPKSTSIPSSKPNEDNDKSEDEDNKEGEDEDNKEGEDEQNKKFKSLAEEIELAEWDDNEYIKRVIETNDKINELTLDDNEITGIERYDYQKPIWKLYYMLKGLQKNTQEYNDFMEKYVEKFIDVKDKELIKLEEELVEKKKELDKKKKEMNNNQNDNLNREIKEIENKIYARKNRRFNANMSEEQRQQSNEKRFLDSVQKELEFHFTFIKEISEYYPLKRQSLNPNVKGIFIDNVLRVKSFVDKMQTADQTYCSTVDKIDDGKFYEIHVGLGLVGGKVTADNAKKLGCKFDEYKLAKQIKDYSSDNTAYAMYPYVDLKEYINKLDQANKVEQANKAKATGGTRKKRRRRRTKKIQRKR